MKSVIAIYLVFLIGAIASAHIKNNIPLDSESVELCLMDSEESSAEADATFEVLETLDIKKIDSLSRFHVNLVNQHLIYQEYIEKPLDFEGIKALFSDEGEFAEDDLLIMTFKSRKTGKTYIHVKSWPGENPYGLIFDAHSGDILAYNNDDSIFLASFEGGQIYCGELKK